MTNLALRKHGWGSITNLILTTAKQVSNSWTLLNHFSSSDWIVSKILKSNSSTGCVTQINECWTPRRINSYSFGKRSSWWLLSLHQRYLCPRRFYSTSMGFRKSTITQEDQRISMHIKSIQAKYGTAAHPCKKTQTCIYSDGLAATPPTHLHLKDKYWNTKGHTDDKSWKKYPNFRPRPSEFKASLTATQGNDDPAICLLACRSK